jgi:hypothetical protein
VWVGAVVMGRKRNTGATGALERDTDSSAIAPKKKVTKIALGDFLADQCRHTYPTLHIYRRTKTHKSQRSDHGPTRWTHSRCPQPALDTVLGMPREELAATAERRAGLWLPPPGSAPLAASVVVHPAVDSVLLALVGLYKS